MHNGSKWWGVIVVGLAQYKTPQWRNSTVRVRRVAMKLQGGIFNRLELIDIGNIVCVVVERRFFYLRHTLLLIYFTFHLIGKKLKLKLLNVFIQLSNGLPKPG